MSVLRPPIPTRLRPAVRSVLQPSARRVLDQNDQGQIATEPPPQQQGQLLASLGGGWNDALTWDDIETWTD